MIGWLWRIIIGTFKHELKCQHQWKQQSIISQHSFDRFGNKSKWFIYIDRCTKCGKINQTSTL